MAKEVRTGIRHRKYMPIKKRGRPLKVVTSPVEATPESPVAVYNSTEDMKERDALISIRDGMTARNINDLGALAVKLEQLENKIKNG